MPGFIKISLGHGTSLMKNRNMKFQLAALLLVAPVLILAMLVLWGGFATRPVNAPLGHSYVSSEFQFGRLEHNRGDQQDLVVLAFSGGGTRAAAFSYGVLEALRRIEVPTAA